MMFCASFCKDDSAKCKIWKFDSLPMHSSGESDAKVFLDDFSKCVSFFDCIIEHHWSILFFSDGFLNKLCNIGRCICCLPS